MSVHQLEDGHGLFTSQRAPLLPTQNEPENISATALNLRLPHINLTNPIHYDSLREYKRIAEVAEPTFAEIATAYFNYKQTRLPSAPIDALWYKLNSIILPEIGHIPTNRLTAKATGSALLTV